MCERGGAENRSHFSCPLLPRVLDRARGFSVPKSAGKC
ncbi:hypothetical protein EKH55_1854 [Sinorhizobium alkalisoli]|nr:hypothetical protein EKH55_1854 [Sinorhizobium alkalisoli]